MRRLLWLLPLLALCGCANHWSSGRGPLFYPDRVGYDEGASAGASPGGGPEAVLTRHSPEGPVRDCQPEVVLHDGQPWLYFSSDREGDGFNLYRRRLGTWAVERLTHLPGDEFWPRVSPDGRWLAFAADARGDWDLYLLDLDNLSAPQLLTSPSREDDIQPAWSPDGLRLAYAAWSPTVADWAIHGLTFSDAARYAPPQPQPRGPTLIAAPAAKANAAEAAGAGLRTVHQRWLLFTAGGSQVTGMKPCWNPAGGDVLAYQEPRRDKQAYQGIKLYTFSSGLVTTLTPPRGYGAIQPAFDALGSRLVYLTSGKSASLLEAGDGIAISDLTGTVVQDLRNPASRGRIADPSLVRLADGQHLFFTLVDDDAEAICSVRLGD